MMTLEQKKQVDAFEYWAETNTENGVSTLPEFICKNIIAILKDKDGLEPEESEIIYCKNCVYKAIDIDNKLYCRKSTLDIENEEDNFCSWGRKDNVWS